MKPWRARYHYQYYGADGQLIVEGQFDYWSAKGGPSKAAWTHGDQSHVEWHTTDGKELRSTSGKDVEGMEHRLYFALVPYFLKLADPQSTEQLKLFKTPQCWRVRAISWVGMAPSRRTIQEFPPPERSTMVVGTERGVGPPSTMRGIMPASCART